MVNLNNQIMHDDVANIRDEIPRPEERDFRLMVRSDHIRIKYDGGGGLLEGRVFGATERVPVIEALQDRGYRLSGGNFDTGLLVFDMPDNRRIE